MLAGIYNILTRTTTAHTATCVTRQHKYNKPANTVSGATIKMVTFVPFFVTECDMTTKLDHDVFHFLILFIFQTTYTDKGPKVSYNNIFELLR